MFEEAFAYKPQKPKDFQLLVFVVIFTLAVGMGISAFIMQESKYLLIDTLLRIKSIFK